MIWNLMLIVLSIVFIIIGLLGTLYHSRTVEYLYKKSFVKNAWTKNYLSYRVILLGGITLISGIAMLIKAISLL